MLDFKITILGIEYKMEFYEDPEEAELAKGSAADIDVNKCLIKMVKRFSDGDAKVRSVLINDLVHELIHGYLFEMGYKEWNNEWLTLVIAKLIEHMMLNDKTDIEGIIDQCIDLTK